MKGAIMIEAHKEGNPTGDGGCDSAVQGEKNIEQGGNRKKARIGSRTQKSETITGQGSLIFAITVLVFGLSIAIHRQIPKPLQMIITAGAFLLAFKTESMYVKWKTGKAPVRTAIIYWVFGFLGIATAIATMI